MLATVSARAQDLGVIGPVYPIAEPNLLEVILGKLRAAGEDGTLARLQRESLARVRRGVEDPTPVAGLARTRQPRRFHHDPSIVVQEAIRDADGRVIVPPGTVVNPLDTVTLEPGAALHRRARSRAGRACTQAHRRAPGQGEGDPHRRVVPGPDAPLAAAGVLRPAGQPHDEARHPSGARARHPGRQEAAHR
ncbi:MAG: hypothetical protein MZU91_12865 [Desulfosudis oleivorans]|nr:hypothetical protein [Desulfosudis oleivorans]